jgi:hypothetical protein
MNQPIIQDNTADAGYPSFSAEVWRTLDALRKRYQRDQDQFNEREHQHLCFLRWLVQSGRLVP